MESALKAMNEEHRLEDMRLAAEKEMNINEYNVEPATNQCMTDFFTHDYPDVDEVAARACGDINFGVAARDLPLNFYDNDDGYWDNYIRDRRDRGERAGLITNRRYFIH